LGSIFKLNHKQFLLKEKRRTRFLCEDVSDNKLYLINQMMLVEPIV